VAVEKIQVPDLGTDDAVEVIEVQVKVGDSISENDTLVVLESDKAAMDIPSPKSGVVKNVLVQVGAQVKTGTALVELEVASAPAKAGATAPKVEEPKVEDKPAEPVEEAKADSATKAPEKANAESQPEAAKAESKPQAKAETSAASGAVQAIHIPDLGTDEAVEVIDILVKVGDSVAQEAGLITLETDKAAMDVPAPVAGTIKAIKVKVGDKVKVGAHIADIESTAAAPAPSAAKDEPAKASPATNTAPDKQTSTAPATAPVASTPPPRTNAQDAAPAAGGEVYAGPAVRKLARELGVDLSLVTGSGLKGRIQKEDVHEFVKSHMQGGTSAVTTGTGIPKVEDIDFSKFGPVEEVELSKLHRVTAVNMTRSWLNVPRVTQFDEADITDLEAFRAAQKSLAEKKGVKLTPLPFIVKACAQALLEHPQFNVSLHSSGTKLIRKKYVNIGVAVATPLGLMVPVVKNADRKSVWEIAQEIQDLAVKAKDRKLAREDMEGACFTVTSLGNQGGLGFTPIINTPEVAILGVSRASVKPVWNGKEFVPRTMLPYSLAYDHRAVNGVDGGMFSTYLGQLLSDIRLMVL
jgi:pyruvate dehydrogenase E2 component (dihydrolipoamide acetyltransferase)